MQDVERRGISLQMKMLIGFLIGLVAGLIVNQTQAGADWVVAFTDYVTGPIGNIFLRLLFMLVIPLLFAALVIGIAEMGDVRALARIGVKTLVITVLLSSIAVIIALTLTNVFTPGQGVDPDQARAMLETGSERASAIVGQTGEAPQGVAAFLEIIPINALGAAADNTKVLSFMFFALVFGIGLLLVDTPGARRLEEVIQGLFDVMMRLIGIVIRLAPIAVACFMFNLAALFGWELLYYLGAFAGVVLLALGLQMFVVYPLALMLFGGVSPIVFFRNIQEAMVVAFSTSSSNATLPTALRVADNNLKLPPRVARFVLTIGATANQNGTAIYEGVTVLFLAQFFGVDLNMWQQVTVLLVCILGGIGTAGIPSGSLPVIALILGMVGVPPAGIGLVLGVDRFLDMCRTTLNVAGDLTIATIVSRGEEPVTAAAAVPPMPIVEEGAATAEAHPS
jgi:DAACS family dicarboxylate/amino acid:cation (Na+ or H+) symporter